MAQRAGALRDEEVDPRGKLLWDVVSFQLSTQAGDQAALSNRAKDLMGAATIASTITGVILNDKFMAVVRGEVPLWWTLLAAVALLLVFASGLWAVQPRGYFFAADAIDFHAVEQESPEATPGQLYRSLAEGFLDAEEGTSVLARNDMQIAKLDRLVRLETAGLAMLAFLAFSLAFLVEVTPE